MTKLSEKTKLLFVIGVVFILSMSLLFVFSDRGNKVDVLPEEGTATDYSQQARIVNGTNLFTDLGGGDRYDSFTKDLHVFGRSSYKGYEDSSKVVGFTVEGEIKKEGETLSFGGKYGSSKNLIRITLKLLKNNRLQTSITDSKTAKNIDSQLPSNSLRNQFISTLPISNEAYAVDYADSTDGFVITVYDGDGETRVNAEKYLITSLKITDLSDENYSVVFAQGSGSESSPVFD